MTGIKKYREQAGMTQLELAEAIGVTQSAVAMWESGLRKPDIFSLMRISKELKCTTDALLEGISLKAERGN